jgi:DNA-binding NtrC family response regulator
MTGAVRPRVLCVDDEPGVVRSLQWLLEDDFDVETCCNPFEALAMVAAGDYHVVVSDQRMPEMTGTEFLSRVKELHPTAMRLLLTGYSDFAAVLQSMNESEVFRFINKPWNNGELVRIVAEAAAIAIDAASHTEAAAPAGHDDGAVLLLDATPAIAAIIEKIVGTQASLLRATSIDEARTVLVRERVAVMVCDSLVGGESTLPLIHWAKQHQPEMVTLVCSGECDAKLVRRFINEGQVFRFLMKPPTAKQLGDMLGHALARHWELVDSPWKLARYGVEHLAGR